MNAGLLPATLLLGLLLALPAAAQPDDAPDPELERVAQLLLALEREAESLLEELSPAQREAVTQRLEELRAAAERPPAAPEVAASDPPPDRAPEADPPTHVETESETDPALAAPPPSPAAAPGTPERRPAPESSAPAGETDPPPPTEPACTLLAPFDTSNDGIISGADRLWRHLYLTRPGTEPLYSRKSRGKTSYSLFELDIRSLGLDLQSFQTKGKSEGYVARGSTYRFQLLGDAAKRLGSGDLTIDATALREGGSWTILGDDGQDVEGLHVITPATHLRDSDGRLLQLACPP